MLNICGDPGLFIPPQNCDDCSALIERVAALERKLANKTDIPFSKTDTSGTVSGTFLGEVNNG